MVTPPVPSRRQVVNPVRPGREQRQQRTRAPGCGWWVASTSGEVSERPKEHAWKVCMGESPSRVRIPPSPPDTVRNLLFYNDLFHTNLSSPSFGPTTSSAWDVRRPRIAPTASPAVPHRWSHKPSGIAPEHPPAAARGGQRLHRRSVDGSAIRARGAIRRTEGRRREMSFRRSLQRFGYHIELVLPVSESVGLKCKGIVDEFGSRRLTGVEDVQSTTQDQCRHTHRLEVPCNQTHGLVTDRSQRHEQQVVDVLLVDGLGEPRDEFRDHPLSFSCLKSMSSIWSLCTTRSSKSAPSS